MAPTNSLGFFPNRDRLTQTTTGGRVTASFVSTSAAATAAAEDVLVPVPRAALRRWNAALAAFHGLLAVLTLSLGNRGLTVPTYATVIEFVPRVPGDASRGWDLVPSYEARGTLPLTALVTAFFALSATAHLLHATLLRDLYLRELARCRTPTRWIEYFFSASLMQLLIAYTLGVRERFVLFGVTALVASTMPFGYWTEQVARPASEAAWRAPLARRLLPWLLGHVPQASAWCIVVAQFYDGQHEANQVPWFVHLILWGELVLFFSFGFVQLWTQLVPPRRFAQGEVAFQLLSLTAKGLLGGLMLTQVLMRSRFEDIYEAAEEE
jgi:hypothetical protein